MERRLTKTDQFVEKNPEETDVISMKQSNTYIFATIYKEDRNSYIHRNNLRECLLKLKNTLEENKIKLCKISWDPSIMDEATWIQTKSFAQEIFQHLDSKLIIF